MQREMNEGSVRPMVAGGVGGLAGTWAMNEFQRAWSLAVDDPPQESSAGKHDAREWQERDEHRNSNELAAQALATALLGRRLTRAELQVAAPALHFGFGATMAGLYGRWASHREDAGPLTGLGFGAALWLVADVVAMPLLGLSRPTWRRPLEMHMQALASHLVYGMTTELVRTAIADDRSRRGRPIAAHRSNPTHRDEHGRHAPLAAAAAPAPPGARHNAQLRD